MSHRDNYNVNGNSHVNGNNHFDTGQNAPEGTKGIQSTMHTATQPDTGTDYDDDYTVDASTMASVSLAIAPDGTCPSHPHVKLREVGSDGYVYQKESCPECEKDFKMERKSLKDQKKELDRQLELLSVEEQQPPALPKELEKEEEVSSSVPHNPNMTTTAAAAGDIAPPYPMDSAQFYPRRGRTDDEVERSGSTSMSHPMTAQTYQPPIVANPSQSYHHIPGYAQFALQSNPMDQMAMMNHMQELMRQDKNAEILTLRSKVDDLQQQLMHKQIEVALLKEKMEYQEKFMQQEIRLMKLAAMAAANQQQKNHNALNQMTTSSSSDSDVIHLSKQRSGGGSGGSGNKEIHIGALHVQVGSNMATKDSKVIEAATQAATTAAIQDAVKKHEYEHREQQARHEQQHVAKSHKPKKNTVAPSVTPVVVTQTPVTSARAVSTPTDMPTTTTKPRSSVAAMAATPVVDNKPARWVATTNTSANTSDITSPSIIPPSASTSIEPPSTTAAMRNSLTHKDMDTTVDVHSLESRVEGAPEKNYLSSSAAIAATTVAVGTTAAFAAGASAAAVVSTPTESTERDFDDDKEAAEDGEDFEVAQDEQDNEDEGEDEFQDMPEVEEEDDDEEYRDQFNVDNPSSNRKHPMQASLISLHAPHSAVSDGPEEFPIGIHSQPPQPQLLNPQIGDRDYNDGDDDESLGMTSLGNTVASSTYGEDRYNVRHKKLLDPYGDKGLYTGVLLRSTGMPHGMGKMIYDDDGRTYEGDWRHGRWHGHGIATFANEDGYEGEYRFDQRHGFGKYHWSDGRIYEGEFSEDKRHGKGTFTWPDGAKYIGDFNLGQRHGQGRYTFSDGGYYFGNWKNGRYDGFGECHWEDGRSYKGEWRSGMAHGRGVETYPEGRIRHDGEWYEDEPVMGGKKSYRKK